MTGGQDRFRHRLRQAHRNRLKNTMFAILGLDQASRMSRSEEAVHVMRRLWRENDVAYDGAFTSFRACHDRTQAGLKQAACRSGWRPTMSGVACAASARMGDGWMNNIRSPEVYPSLLGQVRGYAADAGRDPDTIQPGCYFTLAAGGRDAIIEGQDFFARYQPFMKRSPRRCLCHGFVGRR